jgi:Tol biopolymer transport system component
MGLTAALVVTPAAHADILFIAKVMGPVANVYSIDESGKNLKKLTDSIRCRDLAADVSARGEIVFMSDREKNPKVDIHKNSGNYNLYKVDANGQNLKQLTDVLGQEVSPKFSPDGEWIAYIARAEGKVELKLVKRDGSGDRVLATADNVIDFSWSPDGKKLGYSPVVKNDSSLAILDVKTGESETLLKVSKAEPPKENKKSEENKENKSIDLYRMQIASVQWSPDGEKIAYIRHPFDQGKARQLRVLNLKTGKDRLISSEKVQVQPSIVWSKDGKRLLYSALVDYKFYYDETIYRKVYKGGMHVFISDLNGQNRQITKGDYLFEHPVFSPDEKRIAFLYADTLAPRTVALRTMKVDGSDAKELYSSVDKRSSLEWY